MKVLTAKQMQEADRRTIEEIGIPGVVLMENAGRGVAEAIDRMFRDRRRLGALVLAGKGNNGGDGYVIARLLMNRGWPVETLVCAADASAIEGDAAVNLAILRNLGGTLRFLADGEDFAAATDDLGPRGVLVDALFGTGLDKPVRGRYADMIAWLNRRPEPVAAVDIPSGIDASTGRVLGCCVEADLTVTFGLPKVGLVSYPGAGRVGRLEVIDIGIPAMVTDAIDADCRLVDGPEAAALLPPRPADGHKGTFGHLLVLAGSVGKTGAAVMTAEAGLRGGAGLVTLACAAEIQPVAANQLKEAMSLALPDVAGEVGMLALEDLIRTMDDKQALALGPGLGVSQEVGGLVRRLIQDCPRPMVIDADGLTALEGHLETLARRAGSETVLTPHPGEMARLLGRSAADIQADRIAVAREFARDHQVVLVLKGARTVTATPAGELFVNRTGHAGLASGGMGDVLTGLIGSLLAQGRSARDAAVLGVYLHGAAADRLRPDYGDAGLLAGDLLRALPAARLDLQKEID